jgi:hypothetical protein
MRINFRVLFILAVLFGFLAPACSAGPGPDRLVTATSVFTQTAFTSATPTQILVSNTPLPPTIDPVSIVLESQPVLNTPTSSLVVEPTPCPPDLCIYQNVFFLDRPIDENLNDRVDVTYRFGSTQGGKREQHHGVEFLNGYGTPVKAAADGVVVVAGTDIDTVSPPGAWPLEFYGPYSNFYGNLVVIEHLVPTETRSLGLEGIDRIFTLYAHLSEILVQPGQQVKKGQEVGKIGVTGVSEGSHLHFEVRLGENKYQNSRNPELWLVPHKGEDGLPNGAIAGRVIDFYGNNVPVSSIVLEYLPDGPQGAVQSEIYLLSYEEKALVDQPPFRESFAVGDIPPGMYRISFPFYGRQEFLVEVFPGRLTVVAFDFRE